MKTKEDLKAELEGRMNTAQYFGVLELRDFVYALLDRIEELEDVAHTPKEGE